MDEKSYFIKCERLFEQFSLPGLSGYTTQEIRVLCGVWTYACRFLYHASAGAFILRVRLLD